MGGVVVLDDGNVGGGGKSDKELSRGGGGNCGDWGETTPPACHFALVLTAGGDAGVVNLDPSVLLDAVTGESAEFPGK